MFTLTPIQLILWITALEMTSGIVLVIIFNTLMTIKYKAKERHIGKIVGAIGATIEKAGKDIAEKVKKKENKE